MQPECTFARSFLLSASSLLLFSLNIQFYCINIQLCSVGPDIDIAREREREGGGRDADSNAVGNRRMGGNVDKQKRAYLSYFETSAEAGDFLCRLSREISGDAIMQRESISFCSENKAEF